MRWLALLLLLASPAAARDAALRSGEHSGFTRVVVEDPGLEQWQLRRSADGYILRITPGDVRFDLRRIYDKIRRNRLAAISPDPETGNLNLRLGCRCHARAQEIRPGVLVIDLTDGPPPADSPFEIAYQPAPVAAVVDVTPAPPPVPPPVYDYNWREPKPSAPAAELPLEDPALSLMRQSLLEQLSRGAAAGAVEIAPSVPTREAEAIETPGSLPQVRIGETPGFAPQTSERPPDQLTGSGVDCIADDRLDLGSWGSDRSVAESISTVTGGLTGEFDRPDPEAVRRAVRYALHLGFGAEAQQILRSFAVEDAERPLWEALAAILDGEAGAPEVLRGMATCDTAAALWAVLANPASGDPPQVAAIQRTFSALPPHLRRHLGPRLAQIFLDSGDIATARGLRDAIARAPGAPGPQVAIMQAKLEIAEGDAEAGEQALTILAAEAGPAGPEALLAMAEQQISAGAEVSPQTVTALAALLKENRGAADERRIESAHRRALAASGEIDAAFALLAPGAEDALLWQMLADRGGDGSLLSLAVLPEDAALPDLPVAVRRKIATRLSDLGLAPAAARWLGPAGSEADQLLAARVALKQKDGQAALQSLGDLGSAEAAALRGQAALQLGDMATAATAFGEAGDSLGQLRASRRAEDWLAIARTDDEAWKAAAGLLAPEQDPALPVASPDAAAGTTEPAGPLARGRAVLAGSAAAREALAALLQQVPAAAP
ncbi:MAG: hypothetical protein V7668_04980 [Cereibacter changlensis]